MKKTAPDGAVSGMPAIRETGPGKNLQAITVSTFGTRRPDKMRQHRIRQCAQGNKCAIHVRCGVNALSDLRSTPPGFT
ncbi:hypothetical protein FQR64_04390 [Escherichia coli]|nr:hypothetical protein FQR64_04390 [Escherichia coli]